MTKMTWQEKHMIRQALLFEMIEKRRISEDLAEFLDEVDNFLRKVVIVIAKFVRIITI
jgi:hypothetical protein